MASDDLDFDWGDDPFDGDLDFDMDFDSPKQGKIKSFATGFLSGLKDHTIGDTDARIKTLRMGLPSNFSTSINALVTLNNTRKRVLDEIKKESATAMGDAQYIIGRAVKPLEKFAPNKIAVLADEFSKKDFSGWDTSASEGSSDPTMEEIEEDDLRNLLDETRASNIENRNLSYTIGKSVTQAIADTGALSSGKLGALSQLVGQSNVLLQRISDFQNKVQARNDALKINLMARTYLTNAKFYKFMEASQHRTVRELKNIAKAASMSDYEKTSTSQAFRQKVRGEFFNTAWDSVGGIKSYLRDNFGSDKRKETIGDIGSMLGDIRMGLEMSEGMQLNYADMAGRAAAGMFIDSIPRMIRSNKGKEFVEKMSKAYPDQAKWFQEQYKKLDNLGNVFGYNVNNVEGLANTLARDYSGGFNFDEKQTYEEYLETVKPEDTPLSKAQWYITTKAKGVANSSIGAVLDNTYIGSGRQYNLTQRTLRDSMEPAVWNKRSDRTLNEIIPQWFSHIHLSLEKIRTGNDNLAGETYDYTTAKFVKAKEAAANATKRVFNRRNFNSHAEQAKDQVTKIDSNNALSPQAKNALALKIAKDQANGFGFSPYNFMKLEEEGVTPKIAEEIRSLMSAQFGVTDEHMEKYSTGNDFDRASLLMNLPSEQGRKLANSVSESSKSLSTFLPDISTMLDIEKGSGHYNALKAANIIKSENGQDSVNMEKFWDVMAKLIENPNADIGDQIKPEDILTDKTRELGGKSSTRIRNAKTTTINNVNNPAVDLTPVSDSVNSLEKTVSEFAEQIKKNAQIPEVQINLDPVTGSLTSIDNKMGGLIDITTTTNTILTKILERQPQTIIKEAKAETEDKLNQTKRNIIDRLKQFSFKNVFNSGVDKLLQAEPLVLGGLLGGLAGLAIHDPKAAALLAGGAAVAGLYGRYSRLASAKAAADHEDLYEEGADEPLLYAQKLRDGQYYDLVAKKVISKWSEIKGSLKDLSVKAYDVIIGATRLAGKLFTKENKEVILTGLNKLRNLAVKAFGYLDPLGRLKRLGAGAVERFNQMDVYKEGEDTPILIGKKFKTGSYYRRDDSGNLVVLKGWNEIDGPVYSDTGEVIITQDDYERGLRTSMGVGINKLQTASKRLGGLGLNLLGKAKDKLISGGKKAADVAKDTFKKDFKPVINSIDRIYLLLCQQYGIDPDLVDRDLFGADILNRSGVDNPKEDVTPHTPPPKPDADSTKEPEPKPAPKDKPKSQEHLRKNSFADKERQQKEKEESDYKRNTGIIASTLSKLTGFGRKDESKDKKKGLLGLLFGGATMLKNGVSWIAEKIFGKSIIRAWTMMGSFASMGLKVLPAIGSGIASLASGILTLLKTRSLGDAFGDARDSWGDRRGGRRGGRRTRRRNGGPRPPRSPGSKLLKGAKGLGYAALIGYGADALADSGLIEQGGAAETIANGVSTAANVYGGVQLASGVAGMFGTSLTGMAATAGSAALTAGSAAWGAAAPLLFNPITLGVLAAGVVGYGLYKWWTDGKHNQVAIRMTGYGLPDTDSDWAERVAKLEAMLAKHVVIANGGASLSKEAPLNKAFELLMESGGNQGDVFSWFNGRFKPVFLSYMAALDIAKYRSMEDFDKSTKEDVYGICVRVHGLLKTTPPYPYKVQGKLDPKTQLLPEATTISRIEELLEKLKKYVGRSNRDVTVSEVKTAKVDTEQTLAERKEELEKKLVNPTAFGLGSDSTASLGEARDARNEIDKINQKLEKLNKAYQPGTLSGDVDISDLINKNGHIDPFTQFRLAAYGNDEDISWRLEAVLKLERSAENFIRMVNGSPRFTGKTGDFYNDFKAAFRIEDKDSQQWCLWFRDRFLPVLMTYMTSINKFRTGSPAAVWKSLPATARYEIAKDINNAMIKVNGKNVPIWRVVASPFGIGISARSGRNNNRLLAHLGQLAQKAKTMDPVGEAMRAQKRDDQGPHTLDGKRTDQKPNPTTGNEKTRADIAKAGTFGQNTDLGSSRQYNNTNNIYDEPLYQNDKPIKTDTDTSHIDLTGLKTNPGDDQGVSVPKEKAEQLIIKEMVAAGYNDPKEIAEMLALTNYESGGYQRTTENMRYTSPANIVKTFGKVKTQEQARQLIDAGPVALANYVYGGWLGNTAPEDGYKYRGRGFVQLTGKANFKKFGDLIGADLVNNPKLASTDPKVMAKLAVAFYGQNKLLQSIKNGNSFTNAAKGLNGGKELPGMGERLSLYRDYHAKLVNGNLAQDQQPDPNKPDGQQGSQPDQSTSSPNATTTGGSEDSGATTSHGGPLANLPSLAGGYSGGSNPNNAGPVPSGDAFMGAAQAAPSATGMVTTDASGLKVKSEETNGGGPIHAGIKKLAEWTQSNITSFWRFTALNDRYHAGLPSNSAHKRGMAMDFTLTTGINGSDRAVQQLTQHVQQTGLAPSDYLIINEYRKQTKYGTGGHVHFQFKSEQSAQKYLKAAGVDLTKQGSQTTGVPEGESATAPTAPTTPAPATQPVQQEQTAYGGVPQLDPAAGLNMGLKTPPSSSASAPVQTPSQESGPLGVRQIPPSVPAQPVSEQTNPVKPPTPSSDNVNVSKAAKDNTPAVENLDVEALAQALAKAIKESSTAPTVQVLAQLGQILSNIEKNTKPGKETVKV